MHSSCQLQHGENSDQGLLHAFLPSSHMHTGHHTGCSQQIKQMCQRHGPPLLPRLLLPLAHTATASSLASTNRAGCPLLLLPLLQDSAPTAAAARPSHPAAPSVALLQLLRRQEERVRLQLLQAVAEEEERCLLLLSIMAQPMMPRRQQQWVCSREGGQQCRALRVPGPLAMSAAAQGAAAGPLCLSPARESGCVSVDV